MPKLTGLEVLRSIPDSDELPVCILTNSPRDRELVEQHFAPKESLLPDQTLRRLG
jgi:hypothetical protein